MSDPSSEHDELQALWQAQPQESDPMTLENIQAIDRRLDRRAQQRAIVLFLMVGLAFFITGQGWQGAHDLLTRAMYVLYAAGMMGCAYVAYRITNLRRDPSEPGGTFLRRRLEHSLRMGGGKGAGLILLPFAPAVVAMCAVLIRKASIAPPSGHLSGAQMVWNWVPLVVLAAAWIVVLLIIRPRAIRRLRRDLDELNAAMK
jgi:hypothetical protein